MQPESDTGNIEYKLKLLKTERVNIALKHLQSR